MFGFFQQRPKGVKVSDNIWITSDAKFRACQKMARANADCLFIAWFVETFHKLEQHAPGRAMLAEDVMAESVKGKMVVFVEHHPLAAEEQALFSKLSIPEAHVLSALDEPFFRIFNGDRITEMMKRMGMTEDETVSHAMVTSSMRRAQDKIAKGCSTMPLRASSQEEWLRINLPGIKS